MSLPFATIAVFPIRLVGWRVNAGGLRCDRDVRRSTSVRCWVKICSLEISKCAVYNVAADFD